MVIRQSVMMHFKALKAKLKDRFLRLCGVWGEERAEVDHGSVDGILNSATLGDASGDEGEGGTGQGEG